MPVPIKGWGIGRPDYSTVPSVPVAISTVAGITRVTWAWQTTVDELSANLFFPQDKQGNYFPRGSKVLKIKNIDVGCDGNNLIRCDLLYTLQGYIDLYQAGLISVSQLLANSVLIGIEMGYQRIEYRPEFLEVPSGYKFYMIVYNFDPYNNHRFGMLFVGEEI